MLDVRDGMQGSTLLELFAWSEAEFLKHTEGSAIRRIGHERWQRNIAVALGNQLAGIKDKASQASIRAALIQQRLQATPLVQEHIDWALAHAKSVISANAGIHAG